MVFTVLYFFGLKSGVGANTLSLLPTFQGLCEKQIKKQSHKIIASLDETFFGEFIILVLMDLRSGYLLLEEESDDRCFDTWYEPPPIRVAGA